MTPEEKKALALRIKASGGTKEDFLAAVSGPTPALFSPETSGNIDKIGDQDRTISANTEPSFLREAFPRTTKAEGPVSTAGGVVSDVLSNILKVPGAVGANIGSNLAGRESTVTGQLRNLNRGLTAEGDPSGGVEGFLDEVATDPRTGAGVLTAGAFPAIAKGGPMLPKLLQLLKFGATEGAAVAGAGQAESLAESGELDPGGAALDFGTSVGGSVGVGALGELLKRGGGRLLQSQLKPVEKIGRAEEKIGKRVSKIVQDEGLQSVTGGLGGIAENAQKASRNASKTLDDILSESGERFNVGEANAIVQAKFNKAFKQLKGVEGENEVIRAMFKWNKLLSTKLAPDGTIDAKQARNLLQSLSRQSDFQGIQPSLELKGEAQFTRELWAQIRQEMGERIPMVEGLNRIMNETIPVFEAAERGARRLDKRDLFSLPVLLAGQFGTSFAPQSARGSITGGLLLAGGALASRSPRVSSSLIGGGRALQSGNVNPAIRRVVSPGSGNPSTQREDTRREAVERARVLP